MTIALMALVGVAAGFLLDAIIAPLARYPYEHPADDEDDTDDQAAGLDLASETGPIELPQLLNGKSSYRRLAVVVVTAGALALVGWRYEGNALHLAIVSAYTGVLIICASTDLLAFRVPNVVTYPSIVFAFVVGMTIGASRLDVLFGGLLFGGLLLLPALVLRKAMGLGDFKLALFVGFALGLYFVVPAMLLMALIGGAVAAVLLVTRVRGRRDYIPYAPFIAVGMFIVMLTGGTAFVEL